ncbi:MAG: HEAT repeat domain-containing protein [Planctomycetes bacterium]|nr:HEAT repeat domain-containing protein [Planctomycetota bacterium]
MRLSQFFVAALVLLLGSALWIAKPDRGRAAEHPPTALQPEQAQEPLSGPPAKAEPKRERTEAERPVPNETGNALGELLARSRGDDPNSTSWLIEAARSNPSSVVRANAVHALASRRHPPAELESLFWQEGDPAVQGAILASLRTLGGSTAPALDVLRRSENPWLLQEAAALLVARRAQEHASAVEDCLARLPSQGRWDTARLHLREAHANLLDPERQERLRASQSCTDRSKGQP